MPKFDAKSFNPQAFGKYVDRIPKTRKNETMGQPFEFHF